MAYIGENCPVCGAVFTEADDIVVCPECGTPHHRSCYFAHEGCANAEKHAEGFSWTPSNPAPSMGGMQPVPQNAPGTVICPRCGAQNAAEEPVCANCGARLYLNAPVPFMPPTPMLGAVGTPYVAGGTLISPDETIGGNTVRDTAQNIRVAAHRYIPKFYKLEKKGKKVSWNWAAFFFGPYWFFYRKLYAVGSILLVLLLAVSAATTTPRYLEKAGAVSEAAEQFARAQEEIRDEDFAAYEEKLAAFSTLPEVLISAGVEIAVHLFAGLFGNFLYKRRVDEQVQKLCALVPPGEDRQVLLLRQGGISFLAAAGSMLLFRFASQGIYLAISSFLT